MISLVEAADNIQQFEKSSLTARLASMERAMDNVRHQELALSLQTLGITPTLLESAMVLKKAAVQVNVLVHSLGILLSLPYILQDGEVVESISLGAGNTGKAFDPETNRRVAEFKFIAWKGGSEAIRQSTLFKDFYYLAELASAKERCLYVVESGYPSKFLRGHRSLQSVMSKNVKLSREFEAKFGARYMVVCDYYGYRRDRVMVEDLTRLVPYFSNGSLREGFDEE